MVEQWGSGYLTARWGAHQVYYTDTSSSGLAAVVLIYASRKSQQGATNDKPSTYKALDKKCLWKKKVEKDWDWLILGQKARDMRNQTALSKIIRHLPNHGKHLFSIFNEVRIRDKVFKGQEKGLRWNWENFFQVFWNELLREPAMHY